MTKVKAVSAATTTFKKGDRVVCLSKNNGLVDGEVYEVSGIYRMGIDDVRVQVKGNSGNFYPSRFILSEDYGNDDFSGGERNGEI